MSIDRRDFMIAGGIIAAGAALAPALKFSGAHAAAPISGRQAPGFYKTKVGGIEVTSLLDGGMSLGRDLLIEISDADVAKARRDHFLPDGNEFPAYVNGFLINTGKKVTLVDTGAKGFAPTLGNLASNLAAAGVDPEQVDEIIITHAHPDHTNGLLNGAGNRAFNNAVVRIATEEIAFWYDDKNKAGMKGKEQMFDIARKNLDPYKADGRLETFAKNADLGGGVSTISLSGHTPGHSGVRIADGTEQMVIWADIVHIPAVQFAHPGVSIAFDTDPAMAKETRAKIMDEVAADRIRIAGMHLAFPAIGHVAKRGSGYDFVPQMWETGV